jgi:hypothetical protein
MTLLPAVLFINPLCTSTAGISGLTSRRTLKVRRNQIRPIQEED